MKIIPVLVFRKVTSKVNARVAFFSNVAGYREDTLPVKMRGLCWHNGRVKRDVFSEKANVV